MSSQGDPSHSARSPSTFEWKIPLLSNSQQDQATVTPRVRFQTPRNSQPCSNCSAAQVRCNIWPPNSRVLCEKCKKEGKRECPPFIARRDQRKNANSTRQSSHSSGQSHKHKHQSQDSLLPDSSQSTIQQPTSQEFQSQGLHTSLYFSQPSAYHYMPMPVAPDQSTGEQQADFSAGPYYDMGYNSNDTFVFSSAPFSNAAPGFMNFL